MRSGTLNRILLYSLLFAATFLASLPYALSDAPPQGDEVKFVLPTIEFTLTHQRPPIYLVPSTYMAPIQESLSALVMRVLHDDTGLIYYRLFGGLFISLFACLLYHLFSSRVRPALAVACVGWVTAILLASSTRGWPGYPVGIAATLGYLLLLPRLSTPQSIGLISGALYYVFPVSAPVSLSAALLLIVSRVRNFIDRATLWLSVRPLLFFLLSGPYVYKRLANNPNVKAIHLGLAGLGIAAAAFTLCTTYRGSQKARNAIAISIRTFLAFAICFAIIPLVAHFAFLHLDQPIITQRHESLHRTAYSLKPWVEWPAQACRFACRIMPAAFGLTLPKLAFFEACTGCWQAHLCFGGISLLLLVLVGTLRSLLSKCLTPSSFQVYALSSVLMILALVPSWHLVGDYSVRYLYPYTGGLIYCLIVAAGCNYRSGRLPER